MQCTTMSRKSGRPQGLSRILNNVFGCYTYSQTLKQVESDPDTLVSSVLHLHEGVKEPAAPAQVDDFSVANGAKSQGWCKANRTGKDIM